MTAPLLTAWVPCRLTNPLNGSHRHWAARAKAVKQLRLAAGLAYLDARPWQPFSGRVCITFEAHVWSLFDSDNLAAACKPIRDALADAQLIASDAPGAGHCFTYRQVVNRRRRGVLVTVEPLAC